MQNLQEAVKNTEYWRLIDPEGKPPGFLGWWPSKAVTFVDNHDTGWVARGSPLHQCSPALPLICCCAPTCIQRFSADCLHVAVQVDPAALALPG
jgi:hypothetical protein